MRFIRVFSVYLLLAGVAAAMPPTQGQAIWPFRGPFVVGAQFFDYQDYSNVPYFHGGMDLRVPAATEVLSPVAGTVRFSLYQIDAGRTPRRFVYNRSPFKPEGREGPNPSRYGEAIVTDGNGRQWMLRHLDPGSVPAAFLRDGPVFVAQGETLGRVVSWHQAVEPEAKPYDHIHFEVVDPDGTYHNPAVLLPPLPDHRVPIIHGLWLVPDEEDRAFVAGEDGLVPVRGDVDLIAGVTDTMDGAGYRHCPYRVSYAVSCQMASGSVVFQPEREVLCFDTLPIKGDRTQDAFVLYKERISVGSQVQVANGNTGPRFFLICLTNGTTKTGLRAGLAWRTADWPDGIYHVRVTAADLAGNATTAELAFRVRNRR